MPQMVVRNIDDETQRQLEELAKRNGVSAEEQVRRLIEAAVGASGERGPTFGEALEKLRREHTERFEEGEIAELRGTIRTVEFE